MDTGTGPTRAELLAALSVAVDLGLGQPAEHMLRSAVIGTRIADRLGMDLRIGLDFLTRGLFVMLPLAALLAGLQTMVAAFAKSYREAQTWLGLLTFVPAIPTMLLTILPFKPLAWMYAVPLMGQQIALTRFLRGEAIGLNFGADRDSFEGGFRSLTEALPEAVRQLLPRLRDGAFTRVLIVTLPEATPVHEAERLQTDLRRAEIEPFAWVINQSLLASGTTDPVLADRGHYEAPYIRRVGELAKRVALIPWLAEAPVGIEGLAGMVKP